MKRVSNYFSATITKNAEEGGAWLLNLTRKNRDGEVIASYSNAFKTATYAKRKAVDWIGKRPKWEVNEEKTVILGNTEVRVNVD
jgi:hypothetical protein